MEVVRVLASKLKIPSPIFFLGCRMEFWNTENKKDGKEEAELLRERGVKQLKHNSGLLSFF